jgi:hypothetical protein
MKRSRESGFHHPCLGHGHGHGRGRSPLVDCGVLIFLRAYLLATSLSFGRLGIDSPVRIGRTHILRHATNKPLPSKRISRRDNRGSPLDAAREREGSSQVSLASHILEQGTATRA